MHCNSTLKVIRFLLAFMRFGKSAEILEERMRFKLHDYQEVAVADAEAFLRNAAPGDRRPYAGPTGSGKGVIEAELLRRFGRDCLIITPRVEIIRGLLDKLGHEVAALSEAEAIALADAEGIVTPIRLRNQLAACISHHRPRYLILDECHHHNAATYAEIDAMLGGVPTVGYTATPYRGTPRGTADFLERWGDVWWILTEQQAAQRGVVAVPDCRVVPLVDDDEIETSNGEIQVTRAGAAITSRLDAVIEMCRPLVIDRKWDRPTMFAFPTVESAADAAGRLNAAGLPAVLVVGRTPGDQRQAAFAATTARQAALVQVNVVSEGVDLPELRRLVDCRPTLSSVYWLQCLGRIRRPVAPGDPPPEYICTNRNLARHCYLLEGILPIATVREAQQAFPTPSKRMGIRVVGLENLGRFRATELPLADRLTGVMYAFSAVQGTQVVEYAVLLHPGKTAPIVATRRNTCRADGMRAYGHWKELTELPTITDGFASLPPSDLTANQRGWWRREAALRGLDPSAPVNRRNFVALPVLTHLRTRM
jgi:superfamily II DNA or RNA helicase